ncbi:MAG: hypothetical protein J6D16_04395 [Clostridia bacterium]|nr:hypothetical protein [Clostridia bacterium]
MKKFMNKSTLALLLTVLMLLSAITVGASLFAASAEDTPEATLTAKQALSNGEMTMSGNFVDLVAEANATLGASSMATIELHKDVVLTAPITLKGGRIGTYKGNGHTIYFDLAEEYTGQFLIQFDNSTVSSNNNSTTFENLNFSGQAKGWKLGDEPATFGKASQGGAAFSLHPFQYITFRNCRIENFYSYNQGSVFYYTAVGITNPNRGLFLENTVITGNHALGAAVGDSASAIRTRTGNPLDATAPTTYNAQIYVSGSTYVYDNYDKDGNQANINLMRAQGKPGNENADNRLHVRENFTGKVALTSTNYLAGTLEYKEKVDGVIQVVSTCEAPASIFFEGSEGKGDLDPRVGKVICGSTNSHYAIPSTTVNADGKYPVEKVVPCAGIRYKLGGSNEWTYVAGNDLSTALNAVNSESVAENTVIELLDDIVWTATGQFSTSDKNFNVTLNGNGHTVYVTSHGAGAPMMSLYAGDHVGEFTLNNVTFDGGVTVTEGEGGTLSFDGKTYTGSSGAFIRTYEAGAILRMNDVEIRNFVHAKTAGGGQSGAALFVGGSNGTVYLNSVNIHDNYSVGNPVITTAGSSARLYMNGACTFANNYSMTCDTSSGTAVYSLGENAFADISVSNSAFLNLGADFETESLVFVSTKVDNNSVFAVLTDGELNENANLINGANAILTPVVDGTNVKWTAPTEDVTLIVNTKDGVKTIEYVAKLADGDPLPAWNGVIWSNATGTVTAHTAGTKSYTANWSASSTATMIYKLAGETVYSVVAGDIRSTIYKAMSGTKEDNVFYLLGDVEMSGLFHDSNSLRFTLYGNGYTLSSASGSGDGGAPMIHLQGAQVSAAFVDIVLDGRANPTVDPETDELTFAQRFGGAQGACIRTWDAGAELYFTDVEIHNFAQKRASNQGAGAALWLAEGTTAHFTNVNIHDNYSVNDAVIVTNNATTTLYLSGDCSFENNWVTYNSTAGTYTKYKEYDIRFPGTVYVADDFTTDSLVFSGGNEGDTFATLEDGATLNAGANFKNYANDALVAKVNGSNLVWAPYTEQVTYNVLGKDGVTEIVSITADIAPGAALPSWNGAIYNGDAAIKTHTKGTESYTVTWSNESVATALVTEDNGATWKTWESLKNAAASTTATRIEVLSNTVLSEDLTVVNGSKYVMDFNGFVVTRANNEIDINLNTGTLNSVIANAKFDGKIGGVISPNRSSWAFVYLINGSYGFTFDNCEFYDFKSNGDGYGVMRTGMPSDITLRDVKMYNNSATQGAIRAHFNTSGYCVVKLAGTTEIYNNADNANNSNNVVYNVGAIAIVDDFDGRVELSSGPASETVNDIVAVNATYQPYATVAEGAKITGTIVKAGSTAEVYAADVNGVLTWIKAGEELPGNPFKVDENDKLKVYTSLWYYNNGTENVATDKYVAGVYNYFGGEYTLDETVEAYINGKVAGDLVSVAAAATAGDTVEIVKSITTEGVTFGANCTVNGNNMTLTIKPEAQGGSDHLMIVGSGAKQITINDLTFFGGATTYGKWDGPIVAKDKVLLHANNTTTTTTLNNCTFKGHRVVTEGDHGSIIHANTSQTNFYNCTIVDNIAQSVPKTDGSATLNFARPPLRVQNYGCVSFYGKSVVKDNFGVWSDGSAYVCKGITAGHATEKRLFVGQLAEGSEIVLESNYAFVMGLNEDGMPYDNTGYLSLVGTATLGEDGIVTETPQNAVQYCAGYAPAADQVAEYLANNGEYGALMYLIAAPGIEGTKVTGGAAITEDKLTLTVYAPVKANFYGTNVVVKLDGKELSSTPLCEFPATATSNVDNILAVPVTVGMAEFTKDIVIELQNADGSLIDTLTTSAKTYADLLINTTNDVFVEQGMAEANIVPMKSAMASLLQYAQTVQTFFELDVAPAMTEDDITLWEDLGLSLKLVGTSDLNTSVANDSVKASYEGTLPAGITPIGSTLTMENQISLRFYFAADSLDGLTFKVNGSEVEAEKTAQGYYLEAAHIGTKNLAAPATFTITDGANTYSYTASPMSYVYTVNEAVVGEQITQELKDACEALYYYYAAVSAYFNLGFDTTGFTTGETLRLMGDVANTFSAPRFVTVA